MARVFDFPGVAEESLPGLAPEQIVQMLREGESPPDRCLDRYLPEEMRAVSGQFWTPIEVARRVAEWLREFNIQTVVDIGSGVGKFCVVAAIASKSRFIGIEQRPRLVFAARELARTFSLGDRVSFVEGTFGAIETPVAEAYYLYNPFGENLFGASDHLDEDVELSSNRYSRDTSATSKMLRHAAPGTFLITYNGFGGLIPSSYKKLKTDLDLSNVLRLWRKRESPNDATPIEDSDGSAWV